MSSRERSLKVPFVKSVFDYMCSENCASMFLAYKNIKIAPEQLHDVGCESIHTIHKCLSKQLKTPYLIVTRSSMLQKAELLVLIKFFIENDEPLIMSVIPETNYSEYMRQRNLTTFLEEKDPIEHYFHTILIVGYLRGTEEVLIHDQAPYERIILYSLLRYSVRTKHILVIRQDLFDILPISEFTRFGGI